MRFGGDQRSVVDFVGDDRVGAVRRAEIDEILGSLESGVAREPVTQHTLSRVRRRTRAGA